MRSSTSWITCSTCSAPSSICCKQVRCASSSVPGLAVEQILSEAAHALQRRAQLVGHAGEQLALKLERTFAQRALGLAVVRKTDKAAHQARVVTGCSRPAEQSATSSGSARCRLAHVNKGRLRGDLSASASCARPGCRRRSRPARDAAHRLRRSALSASWTISQRSSRAPAAAPPAARRHRDRHDDNTRSGARGSALCIQQSSLVERKRLPQPPGQRIHHMCTQPRRSALRAHA